MFYFLEINAFFCVLYLLRYDIESILRTFFKSKEETMGSEEINTMSFCTAVTFIFFFPGGR